MTGRSIDTSAKTVCVESPFRGDVVRNIHYARSCMLFVIGRGFVPFVPHLLYTQCLDDRDPVHRHMGLTCSTVFGNLCHQRWFFTDFGMSEGMDIAMDNARTLGQTTQMVELGEGWPDNIVPYVQPEFFGKSTI